jgi:uncharacterized protein
MMDTTAELTGTRLRDQRSVVAYAAPVVVFGVLTAIEGYVPAGVYPAAYIAKVAAVTGTFAYFRGPLGDIRGSWSVVPLAVVVGGVILGEWLLIDKVMPYPHLGRRVGYDPFAAIGSAGLRWTFLLARFYGLVLVVPVMEELFWRSFLLRYATTADFTSLAVGQFSLTAFWIMVTASAVAHPEWLVAAIASGLLAWVLRRTGSLFAAIMAHAVANAALGGYILATGEWQYW